MRVAIVSGFFEPGWSYQENIWAEECALAGHTVRVFHAAERALRSTTGVIPVAVDGATYTRQPLPALRLPRSVILSHAVGAAVADWRPDAILWSGVAQGFGYSLTTEPRLRGVPLAAAFSENSAMHPFDWRAPGLTARQRAHALAYRLLRGPVVGPACARADLVVCNTPETRGILLGLAPPPRRAALEAKMRTLPLGYSARAFGFDPAVRAATRAELDLTPEQTVLVLSSRFAPEKEAAIRLCIGGMRAAMEAHPRAVALVVGFGEDAVSQRLRRVVDEGPFTDRFRVAPFAAPARLSALYQAADVAVFARPSISCQQALGTGLHVVFADDGSTDHLVGDPSQGAFFRTDDAADLARALTAAVARVRSLPDPDAARAARRALSRPLAYDRIVEELLAALTDRATR